MWLTGIPIKFLVSLFNFLALDPNIQLLNTTTDFYNFRLGLKTAIHHPVDPPLDLPDVELVVFQGVRSGFEGWWVAWFGDGNGKMVLCDLENTE